MTLLLRILLPLLLCGFVYLKAVKPLEAEIAHFHYKIALTQGNLQAAEDALQKALALDPHNTVWLFSAAQLFLQSNPGKALSFIEDAVHYYNGDIVAWALWHVRGMLKYQAGAMVEARESFEKALYYNPEFTEARVKLEEVEKIIKENKQIVVPIR